MSTRSSETNLAEVADRIAIRELTARYNRTWEDLDPDGWADTFTEEGVLEPVDMGITIEGRTALRQMAADAGFGVVHLTTDAVIELDGDTAVQVCTLLTAVRTREPKSVAFSGTGRYTDQLVRTADGWRFKRRTVVMDS